MLDHGFRSLFFIAFIFIITACGQDGQPPTDQPPQPVDASYINLNSDVGDYIGAGQSYTYSNADAQITVNASGAHLTIIIEGDESWRGEFQLPDTYTVLQPGSYGDLLRYPFHDPAVGGLSWTGEGRGCNTLTGWIVIDSVTYDGTTLTAIDLRFEQHCEGGASALYGEIHWDVNDTTSPSGTVNPIPAGLWEPTPGATPATGNYVYLESQAGDFIGAGGVYLYTPADSLITIGDIGALLDVSVNGSEIWSGDFQAMNTLSRLEVGYYGDLQRYPFHNPAKGGLSWSGEGRGCNTLTGWFVVDNVTYVGTTLTAIDLRFEQYCGSSASALHGQIHWVQ